MMIATSRRGLVHTPREQGRSTASAHLGLIQNNVRFPILSNPALFIDLPPWFSYNALT